MSRRPLTFKQRDVTRLIKAVSDAGLLINGIQIAKDGSITVTSGNGETVITNEDAALQAFRRDHGYT